MKRLLLEMLEWHTRAARGWETDVWFGGRFIERWVDPRAVAALPDAFARYDQDDIARALLATADLFRWLAVETAERLGYRYPTDADREVRAYVAVCLRE
ncbi:MAG: aminoglycoside 6-adenylyltransferase, partial [Thermomicrobiaceae bacterium]|nr:aminoglycoside 6-adenylyltransferase [Thermomicrobiaceae bacterium]